MYFRHNLEYQSGDFLSPHFTLVFLTPCSGGPPCLPWLVLLQIHLQSELYGSFTAVGGKKPQSYYTNSHPRRCPVHVHVHVQTGTVDLDPHNVGLWILQEDVIAPFSSPANWAIIRV